MNKRIQELAEQAGDDWDHTLEQDKDFLKKFAELIVRECIDCIRGAGLTDEVAVRNNFGYNNGLEEAVINVQKHFGVKQ